MMGWASDYVQGFVFFFLINSMLHQAESNLPFIIFFPRFIQFLSGALQAYSKLTNLQTFQ